MGGSDFAKVVLRMDQTARRVKQGVGGFCQTFEQPDIVGGGDAELVLRVSVGRRTFDNTLRDDL